MLAISVVDCALWDLRGKGGEYAGLPVARRAGAGGVSRPTPVCSGFSLEPEKVRERAAAYTAEGYTAQKWFFRDGPTDGRAGIARNVALVRNVREAGGPEIDIMLDAWSSWDVPYTDP